MITRFHGCIPAIWVRIHLRRLLVKLRDVVLGLLAFCVERHAAAEAELTQGREQQGGANTDAEVLRAGENVIEQGPEAFLVWRAHADGLGQVPERRIAKAGAGVVILELL